MQQVGGLINIYWWTSRTVARGAYIGTPGAHSVHLVITLIDNLPRIDTSILSIYNTMFVKKMLWFYWSRSEVPTWKSPQNSHKGKININTNTKKTSKSPMHKDLCEPNLAGLTGLTDSANLWTIISHRSWGQVKIKGCHQPSHRPRPPHTHTHTLPPA